MKALAPLFLIAVAACAHAGTPASQPQGWESLYGTYEFEGTLRGETTESFSGTLRLADERYSLITTRGACDGRLDQTVGTDLSWGCRNGVALTVRRIGDALATEGTARFPVPRFVDREVCHTDADGTQVCTIRTERTSTLLRGRVTVEKVPEPE